jgi:hypothetical protein
MPSDYYRFLLSVSRRRFLSTDLQSAFWKRFGKEPSLGFPMDLTNLHALLNDQKAGSHSELTSHQLAFRPPHTRQQQLTDGLGKSGRQIRERDNTRNGLRQKWPLEKATPNSGVSFLCVSRGNLQALSAVMMFSPTNSAPGGELSRDFGQLK